MASFNKVTLLGNITRDVEMRYLDSGTAVCDLGMAVNDRVKRGDDYEDEACFVDVTLWGNTAEVAGKYLGKGDPVLIDGRLKLDQWEKDGQKRSKLRVIAQRMVLLGRKSGGGAERTAQQHEDPNRSGAEEIPF